MAGEPYATLRRLLNGDTRRLLRLLEMFATTTRQDLVVFEQADRDEDVQTLGLSAHRLKSACAQVDDDATAQALQVLEDETHAGRYTPALAEYTSDALARVRALVASIEAYVKSDGSRDVR